MQHLSNYNTKFFKHDKNSEGTIIFNNCGADILSFLALSETIYYLRLHNKMWNNITKAW